jgi:hypothetical protein
MRSEVMARSANRRRNIACRRRAAALALLSVLIPSDRKRNDPDFLERTTPLRRALLGEWRRPEEPFGMGYTRPPSSTRHKKQRSGQLMTRAPPGRPNHRRLPTKLTKVM